MPSRQNDHLAPEEWRFVERVFEAATSLPAAARAAFLDRTCRQDPRARTVIESLLAAASESEGTEVSDTADGVRRPGMPHWIGRYRILGQIGEGGTSRVYLGRRDDVAQREAIKVLDDLRAAEDLATMRTLLGRCHELRENLAGMLSIDLDGPYRLIFEPATEPIPRKDDGGLDWKRVRAVRICGVEDTHV